MNLYSRLSLSFPTGDRIFAESPGGETFTYAEVEALSSRYAHALRACGVASGDRVAVQAEKSLDMLMLYLGCLRCRAVFLPLNPAYTTAELDYFLRNAEPALFVCDPDKFERMRRLADQAGVARVETLDDKKGGSLAELARTCPATYDTLPGSDDDLAAILYTSGTTGRSKGAMLTHGNLASNAFALKEAWRFSADDVLLHALPIFHTHGLFVATNVTLACGASLMFLPRFEPGQALDLLPRSTVLMGVPTFYIRLLAEERFTRGLVEHMRLFVSGSAPLPADIHRQFRQRTGHEILERYGMTETNMNTSNPYEGKRRAGTVGLPLPGVDIRITDPKSGKMLPQGEGGMIEIAGPNVFKGYWRMPDRTAASFHDRFFVSGDLGLIDQHGYVSIVGRANDLIISGGYNIYPAEVETALDELDEVLESAVIGIPCPDKGEDVVAVIVPREPGFADAAALSAGLEDRLARFKRPRRIFFVDDLPKNVMGKVQKAALREQYASCLRKN